MLFFYILFCVQVVLESVPVSSSGHIMLLSQFFGQQISKNLIYLLHIPTVIILFIFYRKTLEKYLHSYLRHPRIMTHDLLPIALGDAVTVCFYFLFAYGFGNSLESLPFLFGGFVITTILLCSLAFCRPGHIQSLTLARALLLGAVQGLALLPGISRFGAVYAIACWLHLDARYAFHITWLLQVPLIGAAVLKVLLSSDLASTIAPLCSIQSVALLLGATILGYVAVCLSYVFACKRRFWLWGLYMLIPLLCTLFLMNYYFFDSTLGTLVMKKRL